jgi:hypothetical protein
MSLLTVNCQLNEGSSRERFHRSLILAQIVTARVIIRLTVVFCSNFLYHTDNLTTALENNPDFQDLADF